MYVFRSKNALYWVFNMDKVQIHNLNNVKLPVYMSHGKLCARSFEVAGSVFRFIFVFETSIGASYRTTPGIPNIRFLSHARTAYSVPTRQQILERISLMKYFLFIRCFFLYFFATIGLSNFFSGLKFFGLLGLKKVFSEKKNSWDIEIFRSVGLLKIFSVYWVFEIFFGLLGFFIFFSVYWASVYWASVYWTSVYWASV